LIAGSISPGPNISVDMRICRAFSARVSWHLYPALRAGLNICRAVGAFVVGQEDGHS
jgi:hypothetical protein